MNEFKKVATIDFRVVGGTLEDAYDMMKNYQLIDQAGEDSNIIYNGVSIPAGYCESLDEVEALYQQLTEEERTRVQGWDSPVKVEVDFYTEEDNLEEVFECMQQYKDHGYANRYSNIVYQGVVIPAGYCNSLVEVEKVYNAIISDDLFRYFLTASSNMVPMPLYDQYRAERAKFVNMEEIPRLISHQKELVYKK